MKIILTFLVMTIMLCANLTVEATNATGSFQVNTQLVSNCSVSATNIAFGTIDLTNGTYSSAAGSMNVRCSANQAYSITTNTGLYSNGPGRVNMYDTVSKNIINYGICSKSPTYACSGTGNYAMTNNVFNYTGTGAVQTYPMYAYALNTFLYTPGNYSDTVTLTFTY